MAQRGVNKVILVGNLGNDPEIRYTPQGGAIATLSVATSETWNDKQTGEKKEKTQWHNVVVFGRSADYLQQYARKGDKVYVEGKLDTEKWQDRNTGENRYATKVKVDQFYGQVQLFSSQQNNPQNNGQPPQQNGYQQQPRQQNQQPQQQARQQPAHTQGRYQQNNYPRNR